MGTSARGMKQTHDQSPGEVGWRSCVCVIMFLNKGGFLSSYVQHTANPSSGHNIV